MTKKEKERLEKIEYIKQIVNNDYETNENTERYILGFIFNILTNDTVMNKWAFSRYGNVEKGDTIGLNECINYIGKKVI